MPSRSSVIAPSTYDGCGDTDDVSAHTLRHSVAWRILRAEEGNTLYNARDRLRHAAILTTKHTYGHFEGV